MLEELDDYDWREAFEYGEKPAPAENPLAEIKMGKSCLTPVRIDDVEEVIVKEDGSNDGPDWIILGKLVDGRYFFLSAGCDYTGWD